MSTPSTPSSTPARPANPRKAAPATAPDSHRFTDRVALITGAASGIGLAIACRLGSEGARIVLADRNAEVLDAAADHCRKAGAPDALQAVCDVTDEHQVAAATDAALQRFGRLDVIVNNAGVMLFARIEDQTAEDWLRILKVDLIGAFFFTREAFRKMPAGGAIVNIASIHALVTSPMVAPYAAAKAGLLALTRSAAIEGKAKGIRVNAVLPGAIDTPMLWDNPNVRDGVERVNPQEVGQPSDVAAAVAFLASDDACFIEGASLQVDGGRLDHL